MAYVMIPLASNDASPGPHLPSAISCERRLVHFQLESRKALIKINKLMAPVDLELGAGHVDAAHLLQYGKHGQMRTRRAGHAPGSHHGGWFPIQG